MTGGSSIVAKRLFLRCGELVVESWRRKEINEVFNTMCMGGYMCEMIMSIQQIGEKQEKTGIMDAERWKHLIFLKCFHSIRGGYY